MKLIVLRAIRPDRISEALMNYVVEKMEQRYVDTLWVFTASAPKGAGDAALGALRRAADSFEVVVD